MIWKPDTCKCIFHFESWETFANYTPINGTVLCDTHKAMEPNQAMQNVHQQENIPKNRILNAAIEVLGLTEQEIEDIKFDLDANRKISFDIKNITPAQIAAIRSKLTSDEISKLKGIVKRIDVRK